MQTVCKAKSECIAEEKLMAQKPNETICVDEMESSRPIHGEIIECIQANLVQGSYFHITHILNFDYRVRSTPTGHHKWFDGMVNNIAYQIVENFMHPEQTR